MKKDWSQLPYLGRAHTLEHVIGHLEGWTFGKWLRFSTHYGELAVDLDTMHKVQGFNAPGMDEFAKKLNVAMEPVISEYVAELRQMLANECVSIANRALTKAEGQP